MQLSDRVDIVKNVGAERLAKLNKLNIFTVGDLIEYFPRTYEDRSNIIKTEDLYPDEIATIRAKVVQKPQLIPYSKKFMVKAILRDATGAVEGVWFNMPFIKNSLSVGSEYIFTGKICEKNGKMQIIAPDFDIIKDGKVNLSNGRIVPTYSSVKNLSQKILRGIIFNTVEQAESLLFEFMPNDIMKKFELCDRKYAVRNIHFPESDEAFFKARKRLVFEEFFILQTRLLILKSHIEESTTKYKFENVSTKEILDLLPFSLTDAQQKVLEEIKSDLKSGRPMNRLVQGDVGSGKTAVAMATIFIAVNNNTQAALMAPTDVLAFQHYKSLEPIFDKLGKKCVYLSSAVKGKEKKKIYEQIELGNVDIIIGTHALIQDKVKFKNLAVAITDEQHRFGVMQRSKIEAKGENPHILVMTATPIPRTLGLILYGDLDVSTIDTLPPGRQKIDTFAVDESYHQRLYKFLYNNAKEGRQAYIICSMVESGGKNELKAVTEYTEKLKSEVFKDIKIEYVHGKMKNDEKQDVMERFATGEIDILVSTTVIEVGINVPNATIMVIEDAERFGLSQLHQLRGRVGRGAEKSYCVLVSNSKSKIAKKRLKIMTSTQNGFEISEQDLELRGPGDFFGTRQHGLPEFKIANLYKDMEILKEAQNATKILLENDSNLEKSENLMLKNRIDEIFSLNDNKVML